MRSTKSICTFHLILAVIIYLVSTPVYSERAQLRPVSLQVTWVDLPDAEVVTAEARQEFQDAALGKMLRKELQRQLQNSAIVYEPTATIKIAVDVVGISVRKKFTDSLTGRTENAPFEYKGRYTIAVHRDGEQVSSDSFEFRIKPEFRTVGGTSTMAKAKARSVIGKRFSKFVNRRRFQKYL
jgi:hypothetical protein